MSNHDIETNLLYEYYYDGLVDEWVTKKQLHTKPTSQIIFKDKEKVKKEFIEKIEKGEWKYGYIPLINILPYIETTPEILNIVSSIRYLDTNLTVKANINYIYDFVTKDLFNSNKFQKEIVRYLKEGKDKKLNKRGSDIKIITSDYNDFPLFHVNYYRKVESLTKPNRPPYYEESQWLSLDKFIKEIYDDPTFYKLCAYTPSHGKHKERICGRSCIRSLTDYKLNRCWEHGQLNDNSSFLESPKVDELFAKYAEIPKIYTEDKNIITIDYPAYGVEPRNKGDTVLMIYGCLQHVYFSYYKPKKLEEARIFALWMYLTKKYDLAIYNPNPTPDTIFGVDNIINKPEFFESKTSITNLSSITIDYIQQNIPGGISNIFNLNMRSAISYAAQFKIGKYLEENNSIFKINKNIIKMILNTEIDIRNIDEVYDTNNKYSTEIRNLLNGVYPRVKNPFALLSDEFI